MKKLFSWITSLFKKEEVKIKSKIIISLGSTETLIKNFQVQEEGKFRELTDDEKVKIANAIKKALIEVSEKI